MYTLAFDTTAAACSIILLKDKTTISKFSKTMDFGQSELLIPEIKNILDSQNLKISDLDLIGVCSGPGSFTGVRASVSAARAFALACPQVSVCGVSAFESYARELEEDPMQIAEHNLVVIETKRDDFYYQIFDKHLQKETLPQAGHFEDILANLRDGRKVTVIGDGAERFLNKPTGLSLHNIIMSEALDIRNVALTAIRHFENKNMDFPKPIYLRAPDVCLK